MYLSDEEYVYRKDIADKKRIGYGAFHKKNGSKSKKCKFPSDYLSKKERLKMNSEPVSWNMNDFYTFNDFKKMPNDIQVIYCQKLTDTYGIGINAIGEILFELSSGAFNRYCTEHGIKDKVKWNVKSGKAGAAYNAEFKRKVEHMRVAIVDRIPDSAPIPDESNNIKTIDVDVTEAEIERAMGSFNKAVSNIVQPIDPPAKVEDPDDIFKPDPISCRFVSEGFDLDLFKFLACMYKEKNPTVTIYVDTGEENRRG